MKRVLTSDLKPGMKTAEDVYSYNNQLIVPKDTALDDKAITRLEFYSVVAIRIVDDVKTDSSTGSINEINDNSSFSQKLKASKPFKEFEKHFLSSVDDFSQSLNSIADDDGPVNTVELVGSISELLDTCSTATGVFDMLHNMRQHDDYTYVHSMNVALIANVFATWIGLSEKDKELLTIGGILHDIGKLKIPDNIIAKPGKLTDAEYNLIKTHTLQGYNILKSKNVDPRIAECALMHHERCDGGGYPLGITGNKISPLAKIIAIADVYDAMTSARVYRGPLCPMHVISVFEQEGYQKYDSKYLYIFLERIASTYLNNRVRLSNGLEGEIVMINPQQYSKPLIKIGNTFFDLIKNPDVVIETFV